MKDENGNTIHLCHFCGRDVTTERCYYISARGPYNKSIKVHACQTCNAEGRCRGERPKKKAND